jgi:hypothetical protein
MKADNTLTCTHDLTRLTNAHEKSRHNTLKPTWRGFVAWKFGIWVPKFEFFLEF